MPTLHAIGVGPGDPELLTLKGLRLLQAAAVVFAPASARDGASLALSIVAEHLDRERQTVVPLPHAFRRDPAASAAHWRRNAATISEHLVGDTDGVLLTEGDPSHYSTVSYLRVALAAIRPDITVAVVPGVTAIAAAAARVAVTLALGDQSIAIVPASADTAALRVALRDHDTVVALKVGPLFDTVWEAVVAAGRADEAVWARRVGWPDEQIERQPARLCGQRLDYFSLLIVRRRG